MKEITHKGLTRLVGSHWSHIIDNENLQILELSSIEPDTIKREGLNKGMFEALINGMGWVTEHTDRAKELSIQNINKASEAYISGNASWSRWLGWSFHFITDWLTPYHSLESMKEYMLESKNDLGNKKYKDGWKVVMAILNGISSIFEFITEHDEFEEICEEYWQQNEILVKDNFIKFKKETINSVDQALFSELMDKLRAKYENKNLEWIRDCSNQEFIDFMMDIAKVMDIACQIVLE